MHTLSYFLVFPGTINYHIPGDCCRFALCLCVNVLLCKKPQTLTQTHRQLNRSWYLKEINLKIWIVKFLSGIKQTRGRKINSALTTSSQ